MKYILRTDIIYKNLTPTNLTSSQDKAVELLQEADRLEVRALFSSAKLKYVFSIYISFVFILSEKDSLLYNRLIQLFVWSAQLKSEREESLEEMFESIFKNHYLK